MPEWMPPPDFRFDHAAAAALQDAVGLARGAIADHLAGCGDRHDLAMAAWRGRAQITTEDRYGQDRRTIEAIDDELARLHRALGQAAQSATEEQIRRDGLQMQWAAEVAEEMLADAEVGQ